MQDAHEAIRPTADFRTPDSIRQYLSPDQYNLYKLIYNRTMASLMRPKKDEVIKVTFENNGYLFQLEFTKNIFKGYYWDNLTTGTIADMYGFSNANSVKTQKYKCLQKFRSKYNELMNRIYG